MFTNQAIKNACSLIIVATSAKMRQQARHEQGQKVEPDSTEQGTFSQAKIGGVSGQWAVVSKFSPG
jgi:hypothetical protein